MFNLSDGGVMMTVAWDHECRRYQAEIATLKSRHRAELDAQIEWTNLEEVRMRRRRIGREAEIGMRRLTDRLISRLGTALSPELALALQGKIEADLLAWNIKPTITVPLAMAAWRKHAASYHAIFSPPETNSPCREDSEYDVATDSATNRPGQSEEPVSTISARQLGLS